MKLLYCARCTTPLMSAATVHICPACGAACGRDDQFCRRCGGSL